MTTLPEKWPEYLARMAQLNGGGGCQISGCFDDGVCVLRNTAAYLLAHPGEILNSEITLRLKRNVHKKNCNVTGMDGLGDEILGAIKE